jgi:hypothetical protein
MTGLLVFLGLLGTFWGLLTTIDSVGGIIQGLDVGSGDTNILFEELKRGLGAPLAGMGIAFSSSLFGLSGSLILGFLDLQAGQAQNRFYTELEDWLSTITDLEGFEEGDEAGNTMAREIRVAIDRLARTLGDGGGNRAATAAMANLAEGIQGLVQHMRAEQQLVRDWVEGQAEQQRSLQRALDRLADRGVASLPRRDERDEPRVSIGEFRREG